LLFAFCFFISLFLLSNLWISGLLTTKYIGQNWIGFFLFFLRFTSPYLSFEGDIIKSLCQSIYPSFCYLLLLFAFCFYGFRSVNLCFSRNQIHEAKMNLGFFFLFLCLTSSYLSFEGDDQISIC
jgi:hypothetical protein